MFRNTRLALAGASIVLASAAACVHAGEEKVAMDKLPAAVQAAMKKAMPGVADAQFSMEDEDGKVSYEAEYKVGDVAHSATFAADGKLLEQEEDAKMSDLPAAAAAAIRKAAGDAKLDGVSKVTADGKTYYEADYTAGEDKHEVKVNADGSVISNKVEADDEKEEKHEKKN